MDHNGSGSLRFPGEAPRRFAEALRRFGGALVHAVVLLVEAPLRMAVWMLAALSLLTLGSGIGVYLVPLTMRMVAGLTTFGRLEAWHWSGMRIERPDRRPRPPSALRPSAAWRRVPAVLADPVTWRDLAWLTSASVVGAAVGATVLAFVGVPLAFGVVLPLIWWFGGGDALHPVIDSAGDAVGWVFFSAAVLLAGVWLGPRLVDAHNLLARALLAPARTQVLTAQVERLWRTRADTVDTQALEMRRIERDLHDGAQSRLVALALTLGEVDRALRADHIDVERARQILAQARQGSTQALQELRELVRGIHPPVLADRGLADAVRALALDSPLTVHVSASLPARPHPAVESAVYFAVSELLTNAVKHGKGQRVHVLLEGTGQTLRVTVTDDGCGGADPEQGSGLTGVERRMAAFDGRMAVHSPEGGPTVITLDVPGAWPE